MSTNLANLLYLVTIVTFILALKFLSNPAHARRGNQIGAAGMLLAIVVTWIKVGTTSWWAIAIGMPIGGGFGAIAGWKFVGYRDATAPGPGHWVIMGPDTWASQE